MVMSRFTWFVALWVLCPAALLAQSLPPYVMVERIGGTGAFGPGASALTTAATAVYLDQFFPSTATQTSPLQTVSLPTVVNGAQLRLTDTGTGTTAGYFTRFSNGQGYVVGGYDANLGTASVATTAPASVFRTVAVITPSGSSFTVDTSTGFNDGGATPGPRSVASIDGTSSWTGTGSGIRYQNTPGSVTSTTSIVTNNLRSVRIQDSTLFFSTSSAMFMAGTAGSAPTASVTPTALPGSFNNSPAGSNGTGTPIANSFYFFNNPLNANTWNGTTYNTLYLADERTAANGGGIQRWVYDGTNWVNTGSLGYTLNGNGGGVRGLSASIDLTNPLQPLVNLWATSIQTSANNLVFLSDTLSAGSGSFGSFTTLATAPTNTVFRGVDIAAIPEPTTVIFLGGAGLMTAGAFFYRRRRQRALLEKPVR